jgi:hypothetical protein
MRGVLLSDKHVGEDNVNKMDLTPVPPLLIFWLGRQRMNSQSRILHSFLRGTEDGDEQWERKGQEAIQVV